METVGRNENFNCRRCVTASYMASSSRQVWRAFEALLVQRANAGIVLITVLGIRR